MNTDELIERLARDTVPVRPLPTPIARTVTWLALSVASVLVLLSLLSSDVGHIATMRPPRFWLEQLAAFSTGVAAAIAALVSVVPGRSRRAWLLPIASAVTWMGILAWGCIRDAEVKGSSGLTIYPDWPCVVAMVLGAVVPVIVMMTMLRRGAPLTPRATAAFTALAGAGLSSVAACVSRPSPHPTTITVVAWHLGTLAMLVLVGALVGRRLFRWPVSSLTWRTQ